MHSLDMVLALIQKEQGGSLPTKSWRRDVVAVVHMVLDSTANILMNFEGVPHFLLRRVFWHIYIYISWSGKFVIDVKH